MITEYQIVGMCSGKEVSKEVNRLMREGWQPYGPLVGDTNDEGTYYLQPMVRYDAGGEVAQAAFGRAVLAIMETDKDWNCDTLDGIAEAAYGSELAKSDENGFFIVLGGGK